MTLRALSALAAVGAATLAACGSSGTDSDAEVTAVATTTHVADLVRNVGGERVTVEQFLEPGSDPHEYEPRPSDAQAVAEAAVIFQSGGDLDSWLGGVIESAGGEASVVTLIDSTETIAGGPHEHDEDVHQDGAVGKDGAEGEDAHGEDAAAAGEHGAGARAGDAQDGAEGEVHVDAADEESSAELDDPHWWQDPRNAVAAVEAIADSLADADPEGAETYRANAEAYTERLERLDDQIAACIERVPEEERRLVTTHDAYGYYAERYGIELVGALIPSQSTQAQPSSGEIAGIVERIEDEDVSAVFPQSPLDPELEQAVADEAGATVGDPLWADSLGPEGSGGETYIGALSSDTAAFVEGFSGGAVSCRPDA